MSKYKSEDLYNFIQMECSISCSSCGCSKTIWNTDDYYACEVFFEEGWVATKTENVYCPECAFKKIKSKQNEKKPTTNKPRGK